MKTETLEFMPGIAAAKIVELGASNGQSVRMNAADLGQAQLGAMLKAETAATQRGLAPMPRFDPMAAFAANLGTPYDTGITLGGAMEGVSKLPEGDPLKVAYLAVHGASKQIQEKQKIVDAPEKAPSSSFGIAPAILLVIGLVSAAAIGAATYYALETKKKEIEIGGEHAAALARADKLTSLILMGQSDPKLLREVADSMRGVPVEGSMNWKVWALGAVAVLGGAWLYLSGTHKRLLKVRK